MELSLAYKRLITEQIITGNTNHTGIKYCLNHLSYLGSPVGAVISRKVDRRLQTDKHQFRLAFISMANLELPIKV